MHALLVSSVRRLRWVALSIGCAFAACGVSPKPEPPDLQPDVADATDEPPEDIPDAAVDVPPDVEEDTVGQPPDRGVDPTLDLDRVSTPFEAASPAGEISLSGGADAASPAGATVRVYNLDSEAPPAEAVVQEDGSFELTLPGEPGDQVRIQVIDGDLRSTPVDLFYQESDIDTLPPGQVTAAEVARCLVLEPPYELVIRESGGVQVNNGCAFDVVLDAPRPRVAVPGLELGADRSWPATLAAGQILVVTAQLPPDSGFTEEIFFILVTDPAPVRYAITLRVE